MRERQGMKTYGDTDLKRELQSIHGIVNRMLKGEKHTSLLYYYVRENLVIKQQNITRIQIIMMIVLYKVKW
jgi:hypothetical protein